MAPSRRRFLRTAAAGVVSSLAARNARVRGQAAGPALDLRAQGRDEVVVACVGDLFLTRALPPADAASARVIEALRAADAAFANLEGGLSTKGAPELGAFRHGPALRGHPSLVEELGRVGVKAVSLANNHTGNYGREALVETIQTLDAAGIRHAGAGGTIDDAFAPAIVPVRGRRVALVSVYSYYYNFEAEDVADVRQAGVARCRAYDVVLHVPSGYDTARRNEAPYLLEPAENPSQVVMASLKEDLDRLGRAIRDARARADLVIVSAHLHWGRHGRADLPAQQQALAHAAVDAGADLFVGHGPHVLRGIERYHGRPIAYSVGNFMLQPVDDPKGARPSPTREGVVLRAAFGPDRRVALEALPIVILADGRPRFADGATGERIIQRLVGLSASLGAEITQHGWRAELAS